MFSKENQEMGPVRTAIEVAGNAVIYTGAGFVARFHRDFRAHMIYSIRMFPALDGKISRLESWFLILASKGTRNLETIDKDIEAYHLKLGYKVYEKEEMK